MKRIYVKDLSEGLKIDEIFLVGSKSVASARNGSPYMRLKLVDRTGSIPAVKWNATDPEITSFGENDIVRIRGTAGSYQGDLQLTLESCQKAAQPVDPVDFLPVSERDPDEMLSELKLILGTVRHPHLSRLLATFLDDPGFMRRFKEAPAAKSVHHAWIGGLLEHSLNVVRACATLADLYPQVDRDLLLTAAALHDIGKVHEYSWSTCISISDAGHFVGHIVAGAMMVKEAADGVDGLDETLNFALQHAILAHHGKKEFGSPKQPKSIEALMLHFADDLDAKVEMIRRAIEESDGNGESGLFTKRHYHLERPIFKGLNRPSAEPESNGEDDDLDLFAVDPDWDPFAEE